MNTLGKLLVIVNLLFALATGGFLAVDFASRTQWKEVADARAEISKNSRRSLALVMQAIVHLRARAHRGYRP